MALNTLAQVMQFEKWLDEGFQFALVKSGVLSTEQIHIQFLPTEVQSPYCLVKTIPGSVIGRQVYIIPNGSGRRIYNTFGARLEATIATNRGQHQQHLELLGAVRAALQPIVLGTGNFGVNTSQPTWQSEILALTDIYLDGDADSDGDDQQNLDETTIPFSVVFNVIDSAWPVNL